MSEFTYLFRGGEQSRSPEQMEQHMQKWGVWINDLRAKGYVKELGRPLEPGGKVVRGQAKTITDGPYAETKDIVGGFLIVQTEDLGQAVELSRGCPILERGGMVEVRPVMELSLT
ncbi:MAG: YciI family protein [Candidatus Eremiobacteraeota bacterium]|nr:YciI family protein [Candidatus Eremiobacteraeota bacterium]